MHPIPELTPLLKQLRLSGILDSLRLYQLILWIEEQVGRPVDPTQFDIASELDTVASITRFVEKSRGQ